MGLIRKFQVPIWNLEEFIIVHTIIIYSRVLENAEADVFHVNAACGRRREIKPRGLYMYVWQCVSRKM